MQAVPSKNPRHVRIGTRLGPYEVLALIGCGGMGSVYKARDTRLGREVAIKVAHEEFPERFEREARAVAALNHPNICQLYDVGPNYLVMELLAGSRISAPNNLRKLLDFAVQISDGLAAAHSAGFVHRDLKPDNILVTEEGRVKILDFGLAKAAPAIATGSEDTTGFMRAAECVTQTGIIVGTVPYMSPEQARGITHIGAQSDQFSLGVILYELATGKHPFLRGSHPETMTSIIRGEPEPLPATLPVHLRSIIERLLSKEPSERYDSTRDLFRELRQLRDQASQAHTVEGDSAVPTARPKQRGWTRQLIPILVGIIAGAAAVLMFAPRPTADPGRYEFRSITRQPAAGDPQWSPDGKTIAYDAVVHGLRQIFTKTLGFPNRMQLTTSTEGADHPFWSTDGTTVYYTNTHGLWAISASGGTPELLLERVTSATIHPDGKRFALLRDGRIWTGQLKQTRAREMNIPLDSPGEIGQLKFSPDGTKLAIISQLRPGKYSISVIAYPAGTILKTITESFFTELAWFPDSRRLLVTDAHKIAAADTEDGSVRTVYTSANRISDAAVGPDGKRIVYTHIAAENSKLVEISLMDRTFHALPTEEDRIRFPNWAPSVHTFSSRRSRTESFRLWTEHATEVLAASCLKHLYPVLPWHPFGRLTDSGSFLFPVQTRVLSSCSLTRVAGERRPSTQMFLMRLRRGHPTASGLHMGVRRTEYDSS